MKRRATYEEARYAGTVLVRRGDAWVLPGRPAALRRMSRVSLVTSIICGVIAGWALLWAVLILVFGEELFALISSEPSGDTASARWGIGGGILFCAVVFGAASVHLALQRRTMGADPAVLTIDRSGISLAGMRRVAFAEIERVEGSIGPRSVPWATSVSGTAGNEIGARAMGTPKTSHRLEILTRRGRPLRANLAMHTTEQEFVELMEYLARLLGPMAIPVGMR